MRKYKVGVAALASLAAFTLAACGSSEPNADSKSAGTGASQKIVIGTSVGAPPYEFYKEGDTSTVLGYEPDLLQAAAKIMNVKIDYQVADYEALFNGLDAKRYDIVAYGLVDRKARQEKYDVLDYGKDASGFLGKVGSTAALTKLTDLCGKTVSVQTGSSHDATLDAENKTCRQQGLPEIKLLRSKDLPGIALAVTTDRANYASSQVPLLAYNATQVKGLEVSDLTYLEGYVGFVLPKDSKWTKPLGEAIDKLIADGTYKQIMEKWGLGGLLVDATSVNGGTAD